jgi:hypothetical protein
MTANALALVPNSHPRPDSRVKHARNEFEFSAKSFTRNANCIILPSSPDPAADFGMAGRHLEQFCDRFSAGGNPGTFSGKNVRELCRSLPLAGRRAADIVEQTLGRMQRYGVDDAYLRVKPAQRHRQRGRIHADFSDKETGSLLCCFNEGVTEGWRNEDVIPNILIPEIRQDMAEEYRRDTGRNPYGARGETRGFNDYLRAQFKLSGYYMPKPGAQPFRLVEPLDFARLAGQDKKTPCIHNEPAMPEDAPPRLVAVGDYYPFRAL